MYVCTYVCMYVKSTVLYRQSDKCCSTGLYFNTTDAGVVHFDLDRTIARRKQLHRVWLNGDEAAIKHMEMRPDWTRIRYG